MARKAGMRKEPMGSTESASPQQAMFYPAQWQQPGSDNTDTE